MSARPRFADTTRQRAVLTTLLLASLAVLASALFGAAVSWETWQLSSQGFPVSLALAAPVAVLCVLLLGFLNYDWLVVLTFSTIGFVRFEPAPFDLLFFVLMAIGILNGRLRWHSSKYDNFVLIGLWAFIAINILSAVGIVPIFHSLRFLTITLYLLALFVFIRIYAVEPGAMRYILIGYTVSALITAALVVLAFYGFSFQIPVLAFGVRGVGFLLKRKNKNVLKNHDTYIYIL